MSQFLRDEGLKNLTIHEDALKKINEEFVEVRDKVNGSLGDIKQNLTKALFMAYVIRFDGKGFRLYDFDQVLRYFSDAHRVERIIFLLQSLENKNSLTGKRAELRFDTGNADNCHLTVEDDDKDWADFVFIKLKDRVTKYANKNWIVRNQWMVAGIQLAGVIVGFVASMWAAVIFAPFLKIENAPLFAFIAAFLIFSNCWTFLLTWLGNILDYCWPNISFRKSEGIHWLLRAFIATTAFSIITLALSKLLGYLHNIFTPFFN